jgi:hypothetical protein
MTLVEEILDGERPTQASPDKLERLKSLAAQPRRSKKHHVLELEAVMKKKLNNVYSEMRVHYLRYFNVKPEMVIKWILDQFGADFEDKDPARFRLLKSRILNLKDQWKTKALDRFKQHVASLIATERVYATSDDPEALQEFFARNWSLDNLESLFFWASDVVSFNNSGGRAKNFLKSKSLSSNQKIIVIVIMLTVVAIYINLCVEVKLHISHPHTAEHNEKQLQAFWDDMGTHSAWERYKPTIFAKKLTLTTQKSGSAKRKPQAMEDHPRFKLWRGDEPESEDEAITA